MYAGEVGSCSKGERKWGGVGKGGGRQGWDCFDCVDHNKLWEILKEMGIPDRLTCLLRNLHAGQEATVRTGHGTTDWFQIGKEYIKAVYCHPAY